MDSSDILLVDDDPDLLRLISLRLTSAGYRVRTADSGETALAALAVSRPAVVVTDLRMPGIDGMVVADELKNDPGTQSIPVIMLTACRDVDAKVEAFSTGADDYITKPFEVEEVEAGIVANGREQTRIVQRSRVVQ